MYMNQYAQIVVNIGIAVEKGDSVKINFSTEHLPLVREIAKEAYKSGAQHVALDLSDPEIEESLVNYLNEDFLEHFPETIVQNEMNFAESDYSTVTIVAPKFNEQDSEWISKSSKINKAKLVAMRPRRAYGMKNFNKWVLLNAPTKEWARKVFPELSDQEAIEALWDEIFNATKSKENDPVKAWQEQDSALKNIVNKLNHYNFSALRFNSPKTDLIVPLIQNHVWTGGSEKTQDGRKFMSNIPVEEVWTMPNKNLVEGYVTLTKPFILEGKVLQDIKFFLKMEKSLKLNRFKKY